MSWGGVPLNTRTAAMMDEAQTIYGDTITATQGSPNVGVGASAGTHDGEGVIDVTGADLDAIVSAMREVGFAAWHRTRAEGFTPHVHGVAYLEPGLSSAAADQIDDYIAGRNGLATNAPDDGPRDWVGRSWEDYQAGNPGSGGNPVFRGAQLTVYDIIVTAGSLDPYADIYPALVGRDDATTVTLTAGDAFYLYTTAADTSDGDIYSKVTWRLNAAGHGTIALADSYDEFYTYDPPASWSSLGSLTLDRDDLQLTATPASPEMGDWERVYNGGMLLRITCTSGTVVLDWACLQVEPPAGLLISTTSHWSTWRTPSLVPHGPDGYGSGVLSDPVDPDIGAGGATASGYDLADAGDVIEGLLQDSADSLAVGVWDPIDYDITVGESGYYVVDAHAPVSATSANFFGNNAEVGMGPVFTAVQWGLWPDYRHQPVELTALIDGNEIELISGVPQYEFAAGTTTSIRWESPTGLGIGWVNIADVPLEPTDYPIGWASTGSAGYGTNSGGTGLPAFSAVGSVTHDEVTNVPFQPPPGDFTLVASVSNFFGDDIDFDPANGQPWGYQEPGNPFPVQNVYFSLIATTAIAVMVQMPDFRYRIKDWTRSPDALDTSDPEGVVRWLRNRQRNDGLGGWSTPRAKGTSSRQLSLHNRGYE